VQIETGGYEPPAPYQLHLRVTPRTKSLIRTRGLGWPKISIAKDLTRDMGYLVFVRLPSKYHEIYEEDGRSFFFKKNQREKYCGIFKHISEY
jgi:hypothetical protein